MEILAGLGIGILILMLFGPPWRQPQKSELERENEVLRRALFGRTNEAESTESTNTDNPGCGVQALGLMLLAIFLGLAFVANVLV